MPCSRDQSARRSPARLLTQGWPYVARGPLDPVRCAGATHAAVSRTRSLGLAKLQAKESVLTEESEPSLCPLTPELSRAAKRHRLERLVRPPFPGTCARSAATQPLRRTVQQAPCLVPPKRTMRAAKNSHRALPEADPAG